MGGDRNDLVVFGGERAFVFAKHQGDGWAAEVTIAESDFGSGFGKGNGEVGRDGGFANTTFAGCDRDDVFDAGDGVFFRLSWGFGLGGCCLNVDFDLRMFDLRHGIEEGMAVIENLFRNRGVIGLNANLNGNDSVVDLDVLD